MLAQHPPPSCFTPSDTVRAAFDRSIYETVAEEAPALETAAGGDGSFMWMKHRKIEPELAAPYIAALPAAEQATLAEVYNEGSPKGKAQRQAGRDVLRYAVRFPALLFVVFGLIALYFRMRGGYKPIELSAGELSDV